jgi:dipeptidase E
MGRIVAIGGGEIGRPGYPIETASIDERIKQLTGKARPKLCFLPTASNDSEQYVQVVKDYFGNRIGCSVSSLELHQKVYSFSEIENTVLSSDIIYVGGGNTQSMIDIWKRFSVDTVLREAYNRNIVLSGLSAGAVCWFQYGCSDSLKFSDPTAPLIALPCLNYIPLAICPHFDVESDRKPSFKLLLKQLGTTGIGLDNCSALIIIDDMVELLTSKLASKAWLCKWIGESYMEKELSNGFSSEVTSLISGQMNVT